MIPLRAVIIICAQAEWQAVRNLLPLPSQPDDAGMAWIASQSDGSALHWVHSGWGKTAAAAATQHAIDRWQPDLLINLGTCGGLAGCCQLGEVLLVEETVQYDIRESMGEAWPALLHYTAKADYSWIAEPLPAGTRRCRLASADRDILPEEAEMLRREYNVPAADWESGAIAWVAARNQTPWLILRGVSDLTDGNSSETAGQLALWQERCGTIMQKLVECLPWYLRQFQQNFKK